jgi:hypothetical protein
MAKYSGSGGERGLTSCIRPDASAPMHALGFPRRLARTGDDGR